MLSEQESEAEVCPWQTALEQFFAEFMQFFYPAAWAEIDWQRDIRVLPLNLPAPGGLARHAPLQHLVQVVLRNGQTCRIFIYLGWQFESRPQLAQHVYRAQCALYGESAQPVASFAVLAGVPPGRSAPASFAYECLGNQLGMEFPSRYFNDFQGQEAALIEDGNAFALLTLAQLVRQQTAADMARRYNLKWQLIQSMFVRGWSRERIIVLFLALDWSLPLPLRWSAQLWRDIEQFEEQQIMRYVSSVERFIRERERQQGYQQGETTMLQHLLVQRFGELPLWVGMQIQGGNGEQRLAWLQRALAAGTLEEVFHEEG